MYIIFPFSRFADHDHGENNAGNDYPCTALSQDEFANFFDLDASDPRRGTQVGIYSAYMFNKAVDEPGIHLINLDARSDRDPTFSEFGTCQGAGTQMLSNEQWTWLEAELQKPSEIKLIGSGVQVLSPTRKCGWFGGSYGGCNYCSRAGSQGPSTFDDALRAVNEFSGTSANPAEGWKEIPQERTKLLHLVQESINAGFTKQVIFLSGDVHYAEIMTKKIPARPALGRTK